VTVRAASVTRHGDADAVTVVEIPRPVPGPGEALVRVEAAGLNFADVEQRRGDYPDGPDPPFVPGIEAVGRIGAVGDGVDRTVGERVGVVSGRPGTFAESVAADADRLFDLPPNLSPAEAVAVPVQWVTAHNCLHEWGGLAPDETVLVQAAAGGVGSAAVQLAAAAGATVVGTASTPEKRAFVRESGADRAIDYESEDLVDALERDLGPASVDLVLDGVGGRAFAASVEALADCGRIVSYGLASDRPGTVATPRLLFRNRSVIGYHLQHALEHCPERVRTAHEPLRELLGSGAATVHVDARYDLESVAAAYRRLESRESRGKVVIEP
jgi:NADPH2:quinone reductase